MTRVTSGPRRWTGGAQIIQNTSNTSLRSFHFTKTHNTHNNGAGRWKVGIQHYNTTNIHSKGGNNKAIWHLSLLSVFLSLNLWILRFSWVASVLTLGLRGESRRKIISGGYWGVMQRFNASGIYSSCSVPGWQPELGRWEMAATDQWEAETVTRQPIRCQLRDTDSTVQTPETSHQREKLGNILISSHLASSQNI